MGLEGLLRARSSRVLWTLLVRFLLHKCCITNSLPNPHGLQDQVFYFRLIGLMIACSSVGLCCGSAGPGFGFGSELRAQMVKTLPAMQDTQVQSLNWEDPLEKKWQPSLVFLPGEFHGQRSLVGYSPWGCQESDMTE